MKTTSAIFAVTLVLGSHAALAQDNHTMVQPDQVQWMPAPAALPAEGETIVQISTVGPWGLTYVNPKDDPRQSQ
jgi:hypothetical protein